MPQDTHDDDSTEAPAGELPEFEGTQPVGVVTKLTGTGQRITRPMHLGERGTLVVEYEVTSVGHERQKDGVKRQHTLKALDLFELPGRPGQRLLNQLKESARLGDPDGLPFGQVADGELVDSVLGQTDGDGVVLTAGDLEELGLADGSRDPVVVVLDDGTRALWPDDWGKYPPESRPTAGDRVWLPGESPSGAADAVVREVVDPLSGDQLGVWTDEDEDARLLAEEQAAEAAEAEHAPEECAACADGEPCADHDELSGDEPF